MRVIIVCLTILLGGVIGICWQSCETQRDRRLECVRMGHSTGECDAAFSNSGASH
ncbi:MAG TPA: hypothetical protein VFD36_29515 [Kofleriaceae bacterium]|nr:hypothetical protein [Kofleriaceae bacterium]